MYYLQIFSSFINNLIFILIYNTIVIYLLYHKTLYHSIYLQITFFYSHSKLFYLIYFLIIP